MLFGLSKKKIIWIGILATGLKFAIGAFIFTKLGLHFSINFT